MKLSHRLLLFSTLIGLLPILVIGLFYFFYTKDTIYQKTYDHLTSIRILKKQQVEQFFEERFSDIEIFSNSAETIDFVSGLSKRSKKENEIAFQKIIHSSSIYHFEQSKHFSDFEILFADGEKICYPLSDSINKENFLFEKTKEGEFSNYLKIFSEKAVYHKSAVLDFQKKENGKVKDTLSFFAPVKNATKDILAFCVLKVPLSSINKIMLHNENQSVMGETGESYLVGNDLFMRSTSRFDEKSVMKTIVKTEGTTKLLNNDRGMAIFSDYRGEKVFSSYDKLNILGLDWMILVEIDYKEVAKPIYNARNDIIFLSLLIAIIIIGLSIVISKGISQPITKLKLATEEFAKGKKPQRIDIRTKDEIGALASSFNTMTKKIEEQTSALHERGERLKHFYNATIDGIILHQDSMLLVFNNTVGLMTGYTKAELYHHSIENLIQLKNKKLDKKTKEAFLKRKDGVLIDVEIQETIVDYNGDKVKACVIRDISSRKKMEMDLEKERNKALSAVFYGQEIERKRLSQELHDSLGQLLIAIKLQIENLCSVNIKESSAEKMLKNQINNAIDEVRQISKALTPPILDMFSLDYAIKDLCKNVSNTTAIQVQFIAEGNFDAVQEKEKVFIYRISQEAITNVIKHAQATKLKVELHSTSNVFTVIIEDDGIGFNPNDSKKMGNGLFNMKERVKLINGNIRINTEIKKGTKISISVPLDNQAENFEA